jgi:hypothetical protein
LRPVMKTSGLMKDALRSEALDRINGHL